MIIRYYKLIMHMDKNNNKSKRDFIPQYIGSTIKKISRNFTMRGKTTD